MLRTVEELKSQAAKIGLGFYPVHDCLICGYPCGYVIEGDRVGYDSGCNCVTYSNVQLRSWEELAECYNRNQPENNPKISQDFLDKLNSVWKFES